VRRALAIFSVAATLGSATHGAFAVAPAIAIVYPTPNVTISEAQTPKIRLQVAVGPGAAYVGYYACQAAGSACAGPAIIAGTSEVPPFDVLWTPPDVLTNAAATVPYLVWAEAQNALGEARQSAPVPITLLQPEDVPSITLVVPKLPGHFIMPAAPVLYATAMPGNTATPSTIVRVDFLDGGAVIGSVTTPNAVPSGYALAWRTAQPGEHLVSARAVDSLGYSTTSAAVAIHVAAPDDPPQVHLTLPRSGETYAPGALVPLAATAASASGSIERVEFMEGQVVIATARSAPYSATWVDPPPGNFAIVARAFDDLGMATASPAVYVQVLDMPRAPLVVLTAPTSGSTVPASAPLSLAATALSPDGRIGQVDFYAGATLLGTATAPPFAFSWSTPQVGAQTLYAKARDANGRSTASSIVPVTVTSSLVPSVNLSAPASGSTFTLSASISVSANASEPGGTIAKVDFYANGNPIGSKTTAPYSIVWSNPAAGGYTLSAKATDASGAVATSAAVPITINPPSPTITLSAPVDGSRYGGGQTINLVAQATTPGSSITKVDFEADGVRIGTITATGAPSSATFTLNWSGAPAGTHGVSAKVVAASGSTAASATIGITVSDLSVAMLEPAGGQVFATTAPIGLGAGATETGGTISRVEFYADGVLVGTSSAAPYAAIWTNAASGTHSVAARAFDTAGSSAISAPVTVTVVANPTVQIDAGIDGATVADDRATISGTVQAPINSAVAVNGQRAILGLDGRFLIENLPLQTGANPIVVTLNAQGSTPVAKSVTVTSNGTAPFEFALDRQEGLAPLTVNLSIRNRGNVAFQRISIDTTDDGTPDLVLTALPAGGTTQSITYGVPGLYTLRITVYDASDRPIYVATRHVRAIEPAEIGYKLANVYATLVDDLAANNVPGALTAFVDGARDRFSTVFSALGASLPSVATQLGTLTNVVVMEDIGELSVARTVGSDTQIFMIYLIRGSDGVWRVETM